MSSRPIVRVNGDELRDLITVLGLFKYPKTVGFALEDKKRMILFWYEHPKMTPLPSPLSHEFIAPMIQGWLKSTAEFPREPDHDGSNEKGWLCYTEEWGHIQGYGHSAYAAIEPMWIEYGK